MDGRYDDPRPTSEACETAGANDGNTTGNMFSSNSCFMGGSYYHVRGDAHFSSLPQVSPGLEILHRNISASACHDSRERFPPPRCHPSTRKDILATIMDHITETPSSSKILLLFGSEGTGKSAIAQTIVERCKSKGTLGASFFFSRVSSERNTDKNLIATLAYQLCVAIPELKRFIVKSVEDDMSTFQKDVDTQMERLIINPMVQATNEGTTLRYPILIVVDGLDECEGVKEQCAVLRAITGRHNHPLYFFITSRQETHIVNWLNQGPTICSTLDLDQDHTQTRRDIEAYIRSEFERIRSVHHIPEALGWPSQADIQTLVSKAHMSFSHASEIMEFIDDQKDSPQNRLEVILRTSIPGGHFSRSNLATSTEINHVKPKPKSGREENTGSVITGRVEVDGLRYRRQPNKESHVIGLYPIGTKISITGFTQEGTTVVEGDARWARLSNGCWVALANGKYVSWTGSEMVPDLATSTATNHVNPEPTSSREENTGTVIPGRVEVDGLRYRRRPNKESDVIGKYPMGTKIDITGFTQEGTSAVKGDARWARLSNGYWVALGNGKYVSWTGSEMLPDLATSTATNHVNPEPTSSREENTGTVIPGRVEVDGLRYRRRPNKESDVIGKYPIGTKIDITGFTQEGTSAVKGDARWARLSNGYWVALGNGKYVSWTGSEMLPDLATSTATNHVNPEPTSSREENTGIVIRGRVEVDGLRYRRRPNKESDMIGKYPIGTKIDITGFTQEGTTVVRGDARWARLSNGYWVALANGQYVSWTGSIP
ncbi:hypothetical protein BYT27DRAFT_7335346 [Phlegmacium glaucopus]|nr:hypothetical protein BYT27DRAFT_7335346 [Phlegmacium glaucopus]